MQAALVALPAPRPQPAWIARLDSPWWALVPALSIVVVVGAIEASPTSADALTYLALLTVPPLAAYALAHLTRVRVTPRIWRKNEVSWGIVVGVGLFGVAWAWPERLPGETAAALLSGLACVTLGWLLVCAVPARWLRLGVYAMAILDAAFVGAELLQGPNAVLNAAAPAAGLPQLQSVQFGSAVMGFGDVFIAALVGCLLATEDAAAPACTSSASRQLRAASLVAMLALSFDLLFFALDQLPATVPVAVALALVSRPRAGQL